MSKFAKFKDDLAKSIIDEVTKPSQGNKKENSVFSPGTYETVIKEVRDLGPNKKDPSWISYLITLEASNGKRINTFTQVPTEDTHSPALDGSYEGSTFRKLIQFLNNLGLDVANDEILELAFGTPNALVGMHVKIDVGYRGPHAEYNSTKKRLELVDAKNSVMVDEAFESRDAVAAYAQANNIKGFRAFPDVLKFSKSDTANKPLGKTKPVAKKIGGNIPTGL